MASYLSYRNVLLSNSTVIASTLNAGSVSYSTLTGSTMSSRGLNVSTLTGSTITISTLSGSTINVSTLTGSTIQGTTVFFSTMTASTILTAGSTISLARNVNVPNRFVEVGCDAADSIYLDFHSKDSALPDYSTRIISLGGATTGTGALNMYASTIGLVATNGVGIGTTVPTAILSVLEANVNGDVSRKNMFLGLRNATGGVQNAVSMALALGPNVNTGNPYGSLDIKLNGLPVAGNNYGRIPDITVMSIIGNGNVGIGTTTPGPKFHVVGGNIGVNGEYGIGFRMDIGSYNNTIGASAIYASGLHALRFVGESDSDTQRPFVFGHHASNNRDLAYNSRFIINSFNGTIYPGVDNSVSCGVSSNRWSAVFAVNGAIQTSDSKEKDAVPLLYGINEILQMRTIKYKWKSQAELPDDSPEKNYEYYGFCADELAPIFPELVYNEDPKVPVQMNYSEIMPVMVNAIKEQNVTIVSLQTQVAMLEARLVALESK